MVVEAEDPLTGTTWFDPSDLGGSARVWITAILGITALILVINIARMSVVPAVGGVLGAFGVPTGEDMGDIPVGGGGL